MNKNLRERQAFHNEFKGVLLEYSLGKVLSKGVANLIFLDDKFLETVESYQNNLISSDLNTYKALSSIASLMKKIVEEKFGEEFTSIELAGKSHPKDWGEGDLKLFFSDKDPVLLSLKMIKKASFINTKSAGAYSFFSKYFYSDEAQGRFSERVAFSYDIFKKSFLKLHDLKPVDESFSVTLKNAGISDRPGSLIGEQQELLYNFYEKCLESLVLELKDLIRKDELQLIPALRVLCGFSHGVEKLVFCYRDKDDLLKDSDVFIESWENYKIHSCKDIKIKKRKDSRSYVVLTSQKVDIQFRIKPMNSFSTSGVKINVSVKKKY